MCSSSRSLSSMDDKASTALEAMLREHDDDSVITESFLPKIRSRYHISAEYDMYVPKAGQQPLDPFPNGFVLSIGTFEVGARLPLHPLVVSWAGNLLPNYEDRFQGWDSGFGLKWTGRDIDNSPPFLSKEEAEQVGILKGSSPPHKPLNR
ncbi:hypothetical protein GW17_00051467 [Ensete ventricosum]|nr:hypothetical protein GW17_00051467 [Ensete ventricosum]